MKTKSTYVYILVGLGLAALVVIGMYLILFNEQPKEVYPDPYYYSDEFETAALEEEPEDSELEIADWLEDKYVIEEYREDLEEVKKEYDSIMQN